MKRTSFLKYMIALVWLASACAGLFSLMIYSGKKGSVSKDLHSVWPLQSKIERNTLPTLVMFVHPFCPCSLASVGELERLMPYLQDKASVNVVFIELKGLETADINDWQKTMLWKKVRSIPKVTILKDKNENEAKNFGAETSGHTVLYNSAGQLIFRGGLTPARGHEGDSIGKDAILSWFKNQKMSLVESSIFGCGLRSPASI